MPSPLLRAGGCLLAASLPFLCLFAPVQAGPLTIRSIDAASEVVAHPPQVAAAAKPAREPWPPRASLAGTTGRLNQTAYRHEIAALAAFHDVPESLVRAMVHTESAFNAAAISPKGAQGLMQLMPATAKRFGVDDPFEPADNLRGGIEYLAWLLDRYQGDVRLAAAAYNAGEGSVDRYRGIPPFPETQHYVEKVLNLATRYASSQAS